MMEKSDQKIARVFLAFAVICIIALPFVVFSAISYESDEKDAAVIGTQSMDFDNKGEAIFVDYDRISEEYMKGTSTERTLEGYYSLRQYPGSPPYIPHKVEPKDMAQIECLTCHAKGGWREDLKKHTPLTPHPEQISCRQCHIGLAIDELFVANNWASVSPPVLGRSYLPGAPPPIPHELQMRGNCIACHIGPGAVTVIRTEHPSRGNCRQCHVPDLNRGHFQRKSES